MFLSQREPNGSPKSFMTAIDALAYSRGNQAQQYELKYVHQDFTKAYVGFTQLYRGRKGVCIPQVEGNSTVIKLTKYMLC